jgi:hypothetical protein
MCHIRSRVLADFLLIEAAFMASLQIVSDIMSVIMSDEHGSENLSKMRTVSFALAGLETVGCGLEATLLIICRSTRVAHLAAGGCLVVVFRAYMQPFEYFRNLVFL